MTKRYVIHFYGEHIDGDWYDTYADSYEQAYQEGIETAEAILDDTEYDADVYEMLDNVEYILSSREIEIALKSYPYEFINQHCVSYF